MPISSITSKEIVAGYQQLVARYVAEGWQAYLVTLMFYQLPANRDTKFQIMSDEMSRIYSILISHVLRRPNSKRQSQYAPFLIGCPDNHVRKADRSVARANVNDGWHFNVIILLPPDRHSRFREHLGNHITNNLHRYAPPDRRVDRINVKAITETPEIATNYALKHFIRGNMDGDNILVLPRPLSELSKGGKELVVGVQTYLTGTIMHAGYHEVDRLDKIWRRETADFNPLINGKPEMSVKEIRALIRAFKEMRREFRESIRLLRKFQPNDSAGLKVMKNN